MAGNHNLATADDVETSKTTQILETDEEKKTRLLSLKIIYFTMFLMTLGFSIILTGIYPYLDKVLWFVMISLVGGFLSWKL